MASAETLHVVLAQREPGPRIRKISEKLPRSQAVLMVRDEWLKGHVARLFPPLGYVEPEPVTETLPGTA